MKPELRIVRLNLSRKSATYLQTKSSYCFPPGYTDSWKYVYPINSASFLARAIILFQGCTISGKESTATKMLQQKTPIASNYKKGLYVRTVVGDDNVSRILPGGIDAQCNAIRSNAMRRVIFPVPDACPKGQGGHRIAYTTTTNMGRAGRRPAQNVTRMAQH